MALFGETNEALPTVTFAVVAGTREIANVQVYSDQDLVTKQLDGRALPLDPGRHSLRFVLPRGRVLTSEILLREGEKNRLIKVRADPDREPRSASPEADHGVVTTSARPLPTSFWIVSGVGLTALVSGTVFALLGSGEEEHIAACAPSCPPDARPYLDRARRDYVVANISFAVAAVSVVSASAIYLSAPSLTVKPPPVVSTLNLEHIAVVPSRHGLSAKVGFRFTSF